MEYRDRVFEVSYTTGSGDVKTLSGTTTGFRTALAAFGSGDHASEWIMEGAGGQWEIFRGTVNGTTLTRTAVLASSNGGSAVNFSAGRKEVRCLLTAATGESLDRFTSIDTSTGLVAQTGAATFAKRTLTAPAAGIAVTNGGGVAGNPTLALANDLAAVEGLSGTGIAVRTGTDTWANRTLTAPAAGVAVTNGDGVSGNPTLALANDLAAVEGLSGTGIAVRTGTDTWANRTLTAPAAGITVTNGDGVSGNPTLALANDLAAYEGLSSTGIVCRNAANSAAVVVITAGTGVTVTNGDGVVGNPTIAIDQVVATSSTPQFAGLGVGVAAASNMGINLNPTLLGASTQYGFFSAPASSGTAPAIFSAAVTQALTKVAGGAVTYASVRGMWCASNSKQNAGDTVTENVGLLISDQTIGATNYAIYTGLGGVSLGDHLTLRDKDIVVGTTTGTKIGTATNQKLGFFNATPVVQPAHANQAALTDSTGGTAGTTLVDAGAAYSQTNINNNIASLARLVNRLRSELVTLGLIKGSA